MNSFLPVDSVLGIPQGSFPFVQQVVIFDDQDATCRRAAEEFHESIRNLNSPVASALRPIALSAGDCDFQQIARSWLGAAESGASVSVIEGASGRTHALTLVLSNSRLADPVRRHELERTLADLAIRFSNILLVVIDSLDRPTPIEVGATVGDADTGNLNVGESNDRPAAAEACDEYFSFPLGVPISFTRIRRIGVRGMLVNEGDQAQIAAHTILAGAFLNAHGDRFLFETNQTGVRHIGVGAAGTLASTGGLVSQLVPDFYRRIVELWTPADSGNSLSIPQPIDMLIAATQGALPYGARGMVTPRGSADENLIAPALIDLDRRFSVLLFKPDQSKKLRSVPYRNRVPWLTELSRLVSDQRVVELGRLISDRMVAHSRQVRETVMHCLGRQLLSSRRGSEIRQLILGKLKSHTGLELIEGEPIAVSTCLENLRQAIFDRHAAVMRLWLGTGGAVTLVLILVAVAFRIGWWYCLTGAIVAFVALIFPTVRWLRAQIAVERQQEEVLEGIQRNAQVGLCRQALATVKEQLDQLVALVERGQSLIPAADQALRSSPVILGTKDGNRRVSLLPWDRSLFDSTRFPEVNGFSNRPYFSFCPLGPCMYHEALRQFVDETCEQSNLSEDTISFIQNLGRQTVAEEISPSDAPGHLQTYIAGILKRHFEGGMEIWRLFRGVPNSNSDQIPNHLKEILAQAKHCAAIALNPTRDEADRSGLRTRSTRSDVDRVWFVPFELLRHLDIDRTTPTFHFADRIVCLTVTPVTKDSLFHQARLTPGVSGLEKVSRLELD